MARVDATVVSITCTTVSTTGSYRDITQQCLEMTPGIMHEAILQETHTFGDAWTEQGFTGLRRLGEITFRGFYDDDTSTGVAGIFGNTTDVGAERVFKIKTGTTNLYPKFDCIVRSFTRNPKVGELTPFELVVAPTGALTFATT